MDCFNASKSRIVIKGIEGAGKNLFTDILCNILGKYATQNLTDIEQIAGQFNTGFRDKMLVICNELENNSKGNYSDKLKSVITEEKAVINEKCMPAIELDNVVNLMFITNNELPVWLSSKDRRYLIVDVSSKYVGKFDYFDKLVKIKDSKNPKFYNNLLTFFMKINLKDFNVRNIPMTKAKEIIIDACRNPTEKLIEKHYEEFKNGIRCDDVLYMKPDELKERTFTLQLNKFCEKKQKRYNGVRKYYYILKEEHLNEFKPEEIEDEEEEIEEIENFDLYEFIKTF